MKQIMLTQGKYALVDDEDYDFLLDLANSNRYGQWSYTNHGYARLNINGAYILMHRIIMNTPAGMDTDHVNRNKLDNRRSNLRVCTQQENRRNAKLLSTNTSGVTGVHYKPTRGKWHARITVNYRRISLGYHLNKEDAIKARKAYEKRYFKEFVPIN